MQAIRILVIDPDNYAIGRLFQVLKLEGYICDQINDASACNDGPPNARPDLVILVSTRRSVKETIIVIKKIKKCSEGAPVFLIPKHSSESLAVSAFRAGISDYFNDKFSNSDLLTSIRKHLHLRPQSSSPSKDSGENASRMAVNMLGNSFKMKKIKDKLYKYAATDCTVMITGETGTGKDLAAKLVHENSPRKRKPLVCLNCAALPESLVESELFGYETGAFTGAVIPKKGKFVQASGGTLFLDEIGEMSHLVQAKILRTIENKTVHPLSSRAVVDIDIRLIAATNQNLEQLVAEGNFRKDLYFRLNVARVSLPPLRDRKEDIPDLVTNELKRLNLRFNRNVSGITGEAMSSFFLYDWPGNIRELKNMLEVAFINCSGCKIIFSDLPDIFTKKLKFSKNGYINDRDMLLAALSCTRWNKSKAAKKLNWSRMKVYRTFERYKISPKPTQTTW